MGATKVWHESFSRDLGMNIVLSRNYKREEIIPSCSCTTGMDHWLHPTSPYSILRLISKSQTLASSEEGI
jgi:hypothetical protein